jgi:hypothetical protein
MMSVPEASGPALSVRHTGQVFPLTQAPVTIGRMADNVLVLSDSLVSRHHAAISWQAGTYVVEDLGSANGTYVNERRITAPQELRHGYVVRLGNTILDVQMAPASAAAGAPQPAAAPPPPASRRPTLLIFVGLLAAGLVILCSILAVYLLLSGGKPVVTIQAPLEGTRIQAGSEVLLQATATGSNNIARLELSVDDMPVAVTTSPEERGQPSLSVSQPWTFAQAGPHVVSAVAFDARGKMSEVSYINVTVEERVVEATPATPTASPTPTVSPSTTPIPTIPPPPTETPLPEIPTNTPTLTPLPTNTPVPPTPTATLPPPPVIEFFRADPTEIVSGECTTLEWGAVDQATGVTIDHGIGGVGTPGSWAVCPTETTTYVMTATGPGGTGTASALVTVSAPLPDLTVDSITFFPSPPVQNSDNEVRIAISNIGAGAAGPFEWEWQPGSATPFTGLLVGGLGAGETNVVTLIWNPASWYANLPTAARVDTGDAVTESDEDNNELQVNVQVVASTEVIYSRTSQAALDGYVIGGQAPYNALDIRVGNIATATGERVYRGFMSFDLSGIPAGANVLSAQLRFWQGQLVGDPYGKLGTLLMKHVDYGGSLDTTDFDGPELGSAILATHTSPDEWYNVTSGTVATWVRDDLAAGRPRFQVRLQFSPETDDGTTTDYASFESGNNTFGTGNVPELIVTYLP